MPICIYRSFLLVFNLSFFFHYPLPFIHLFISLVLYALYFLFSFIPKLFFLLSPFSSLLPLASFLFLPFSFCHVSHLLIFSVLPSFLTFCYFIPSSSLIFFLLTLLFFSSLSSLFLLWSSVILLFIISCFSFLALLVFFRLFFYLHPLCSSSLLSRPLSSHFPFRPFRFPIFHFFTSCFPSFDMLFLPRQSRNFSSFFILLLFYPRS